MRFKTIKPKKHLLAIAAGLLIFAISYLLAGHKLSGTEKSVFEFIYGWPDFWKPVFWSITQLGSLWMFIAAIGIYFWQRKTHLAVKLTICGISSHFLVQLLKSLIDRPRPEHLLANVIPRETFTPGLGFPSGHVAGVTILALIIAPYLKKKYRWLAYASILLVALSRIYLGVHSPLDVTAGFAVGLVIVKSYELILLKLGLEKAKN